MSPEQQKLMNFRRKVSARIDASRTVGKDDNSAIDSILQFNDLPSNIRSQAIQAKASGQAKDFVDAYSQHLKSNLTPENTAPTTDSMETPGILGTISRVAGTEKLGRYLGFKLANNLPEWAGGLSQDAKDAVSKMTPEEQARFRSGGVSGKEAIGSAATTALNLAGGTLLKGAGAALGYGGRALGLTADIGRIAGRARTLTPAVLASKPVATLAKGAGIGYANDIANKMSDNKSLGEILTPGMDTAIGATLGAIPGARNLIQGKGLAGDKVQKEAAKLTQMVAPDVKDFSAKEYKDLVAKGRITPGTATKAPQYILSDKELAATMRHSDLIDKDPLKTALNINTRMGELDSKVGDFLLSNNHNFSTPELTSHIKRAMGGVTDVSVPEERIKAVRDQMIKNFTGSLESKDMHSLWQARKGFDQQIESAFSGSPTLQKDMKLAFRNAVQDFIASKTPNQTYKQAMGDMSSLYNLQDLQVMSASKRRNSGIGNWMKDNPKKTRALMFGAGAAAAGVAGTAGIRSLTGGGAE